MKAAVVIPTYNERENIARLIDSIQKLALGLKIVVIDDNSPDGTGKIVDGLASQADGLDVIHRESRLGLGTAYLAGFEWAIAEGMDLILTMDADFSHDPKFIPLLIDKVQSDADVVIGSRYVSGGKIRNWSFWRRFLSKGANLFACKILGLNSCDNTSGFRCYKRRVLKNILKNPPFSDGYSFLIEITTRCQREGYLVKEVPIIFVDREFGMTKISWWEIIKALYTVFRLRLTRKPR